MLKEGEDEWLVNKLTVSNVPLTCAQLHLLRRRWLISFHIFLLLFAYPPSPYAPQHSDRFWILFPAWTNSNYSYALQSGESKRRENINCDAFYVCYRGTCRKFIQHSATVMAWRMSFPYRDSNNWRWWWGEASTSVKRVKEKIEWSERTKHTTAKQISKKKSAWNTEYKFLCFLYHKVSRSREEEEEKNDGWMRKRHIAMLAEEWVSERLNRWWDWGDWKEFPVLNHKRKWDEREKWKANEQFYSAELIQEALNEANEDGKASREERRERSGEKRSK